MIRTPLRPLARILEARAKGENPDAIERENMRIRHEQMRDRARKRAEGRLLVLGVLFFCAFAVIGARMGVAGHFRTGEPRASVRRARRSSAQRADIVDRNGRILATNFETHALYAQPPADDRPGACRRGAGRDLSRSGRGAADQGFHRQAQVPVDAARKSAPNRSRRCMTSASRACCLARARCAFIPMARWPRMCWAGASFGREGVHAAEVIGVAGDRKVF